MILIQLLLLVWMDGGELNISIEVICSRGCRLDLSYIVLNESYQANDFFDEKCACRLDSTAGTLFIQEGLFWGNGCVGLFVSKDCIYETHNIV